MTSSPATQYVSEQVKTVQTVASILETKKTSRRTNDRNGGNSGGKNFDTDSSIINSWDRIKMRAVDNLPTRMPQTPNSPLTTVDKQKITDWVNAGHRQSD